MRRRWQVGWRALAVLSGLALIVHCYGLYRPEGPPASLFFPYADKVQHIIGFGLPLLLILLTLAVRAHAERRRLSGSTVLLVAGLFAAHAVVSEVVQGVAYRARTGDPLDVAADALGVLLGVAAFRLTAPRLTPVGAIA